MNEEEKEAVVQEELEDISAPEENKGVKTIVITVRPDGMSEVEYQLDGQPLTKDEYDVLPARLANLFELAELSLNNE